MKGIIGRKLGMTQVFDEETGKLTPVTVIQAGPCPVVAIRTQDTDGYDAVQLAFDAVAEGRLTKPRLGHLKKHDVAPLRRIIEARNFKLIEALASRYDVSVSSVLLASFQLLLWRLTQQTEIVTGVATGGRNYEELETALGLFVAIPAVWFYNYLTSRLEYFNVEMDNSSSELVDYFIKKTA